MMSILMSIQTFARAAWTIKWLRYALAGLAVFFAVLYWHNSRVDAAVTAYAKQRNNDDAAALAKARGEAQLKSDQNAAATTALDKTHYKELQNANQTIKNLRTALAAGTISLRRDPYHSQPNKPALDPSSRMGDVATTEPGESGRLIAQDVLDLGEMSKTCIAQRDYLQDKHRADITTVNGVQP